MLFTRLLALFIIVPLVELAIFSTVSELVSIPGMLLLVIITAALGASLTRWQGLKTLERFRARMGEGKIPGHEVVSGVLILLAGALLLTPGFLTDAVGFALLIPPVRWAIGKYMMRRYAQKIGVHVEGAVRSGEIPRESGRPGIEVPAKGRIIDVEATSGEGE